MKRFKYLVLSLFVLFALNGCNKELRGELDALQDQIDALSDRIDQLNATVSSLGDIVREIQNGGYIRDCVEVQEGGTTIGWRLTFSDGKEIMIYHGKNGKDGANGHDGQNGQDGHSPMIGVRQDSTDGLWYWTLDGDWLTDAEGNRVRASGIDGQNGQDGQNGHDGHDGQNGKDAIAPQLKIEDDYWYISTDGGETWTQLGKARGDNGADGADGDSFFQSVDTTDPDMVVLTLADGTVISIPTWRAFEALRDLVNQMNRNLNSLQEIVTALQNNDYLQSITPYYDDDVLIGYILSFSKSGSVIIYHGKDGKDGVDGQNGHDGQNGQDGHSPVVGVRQDTDGLWYWTLDGEWLTDNMGNKVRASGIDGANGHDAIAPQLKIENDYWYISTDGGVTWNQLGKAKGEDGADGADGTDGADGDSFFQGVDTTDPDKVVLTLADGTEISIPTWKAFTELQALVNQINTNLSSLQEIVTALANNDYVQSVTPYYENGVQVGYILVFSKSGNVIIYHGKDGKDGVDGQNGHDGHDGQNGQDGHSPVVGLRQDTDGQWYWTLDGEWLLDSNNNKVRASGIDGTNGQDAIAPRLKIENDYWYMSTDGGTTWTQLGKAKGEDGANGQDGHDGQNGQDGDSFFQGVDTSDPYKVVLTLSDGTVISIPTWKAFEELQTLVNQINTNLASLQTIVTALQNNDYVQSVDPVIQDGVTIGYTITFTKSGTVTIYHGQNGQNGQDGQNGHDGHDGQNGQDGHTPQIGVRQDTDGQWYWTLDGDWLTDNIGNKVRASGIDGTNGQDAIAPKLKIENDYWYMSTDGGLTWTILGKAKGEDGANGADGQNGQDGDSFFQSVDVSSPDKVVLVLADGTRLELNRYMAVTLNVTVPDEILIAPGEVLSFNYTLEGTVTDKTMVTVSSDGNYKVRITKTNASSGKVHVTCPDPYVDGFVNIMVKDGHGNTDFYVLDFHERKLSFDKDVYAVDYSGGVVEIPVQYNFDYTLQLVGDAGNWITIVRTRAAMQDGTIQLSVAENSGTETRSGQIRLCPSDNLDFALRTITIRQRSEQSAFLPGEAVDLGLSVKWSSCNLGAANPEEFGQYYAWGETETKLIYNWSTYKWGDSETTLTKYNTDSSRGFVDDITELLPEDDVVQSKLGGGWRMPTKTEFQELTNNCTHVWITYKGVQGMKFTSNREGYTDKWIFFPATGWMGDSSVGPNLVGRRGCYWSSTLRTDCTRDGVFMAFNPTGTEMDFDNGGNRTRGHTIRPVLADNSATPVEDVSIDPSYGLLLETGSSSTMTVTVLPSSASHLPVSWSSTDPYIATVDQNGNVNAIREGNAYIIATCGGKVSRRVVIVKAAMPSGPVDLGLSVKWAQCNVGASTPEQYGDYFAWGETETKSSFWGTGYKWGSGIERLTKYNTDSSVGPVDNITELEAVDDAAHVILGGDWRMPMRTEFQELKDNTTCAAVSYHGQQGMVFISEKSGFKDKWIFLPATGHKDGDVHHNKDRVGRYWSSTLFTDDPPSDVVASAGTMGAWIFGFRDRDTLYFNWRIHGRTIRPVYGRIPVSSVTIEPTELTLNINTSSTLIAKAYPSNATDNTLTWSTSNASVATVDQLGEVTTVSAGTVTITATANDGSGKRASCTIHVQEAVDLGLSVKWASCNLGASSVEDYGDYYAWGETVPYYSSKDPLTWMTGKSAGYAWSSYKWCNGSENTLTKYCYDSSYGTVDDLTVLQRGENAGETIDDAARAVLGGTWRMPKVEEWSELRQQCSREWVTRGGIPGLLITGPNGNSIFLPAGGGWAGTGPANNTVGVNGFYWSSSLFTSYSDTRKAWYEYFNSSSIHDYDRLRCQGATVRPVTE